jgi:hypothetical protein
MTPERGHDNDKVKLKETNMEIIAAQANPYRKRAEDGRKMYSPAASASAINEPCHRKWNSVHPNA